ncbi:peptidylprolyl isomerase [Psychroserpens sp. SPM9]|uniref:peptidylprolyl isomerase n=1 Tax=Psychroserpens sp. SPM9 TaxID=2975598 RepID=UPI0021A7118D|nr:peptidylprolyl isomerase [Psychroserpens sp. SPM9]MDG5491541.1 peptidylprolyl isomerase [Psychroserpens sp. SPM9]
MLKTLLSATLIFMTSIVVAQDNFEKSLDSVQTLDDVNLFFKKNKKAKGKVIVFNEEKHKTKMAEDILKMGIGSKKYFKDAPQKTYYKVIEKYEIPYYRVSCVYLDGSIKSLEEINNIRQDVISKYKQGYRFTDLAKRYSMDNTAKQGGDLGWFTYGDLHPEFEKQVLKENHSVNDIFTIDIPEIKAYYVVLMTQDKKLIEEAKVLKVTEPRK